ncbi:M14 family metallopeptidase [Flavilitoribacter nigricans]|uniref:Peptidase M14 n=1 Tax=Flavilitoribacter nigricans (strain ATCC 23147 / DSM 23189 / NBRC 102662 / NCIMB 1420 / SS-2) TaxID=1122177 RepID=A0A2D0MZF2_FLAN2|nr:M14 family metallopeptidase [Flavilitoribacter nigricans]PHN01654.1 peptidase M14 [Flavilitoribacter nigricans DSM 23189 = NBRC 102662]
MKFQLYIILFLLLGTALHAQTPDQFFKASGTPANPKVDVSWNRYNTAEGLAEIAKKIAAAYPELAKLSSIGKSYQGRDLWCLTITDFNSGDPDRKPGFYIDGNIHSNEIQGAEIAMYTAWYLTESFDENAFIKDLLTKRIFYIVPTINPDARNDYMQGANTAHSPRSGMIPIDDDRDGEYDEDGYEDLNGDGHVSQMRRKNPYGRWIDDPRNPGRMIRAENDERGTYENLGYEGIDNDGDGQVNEDRVGGYYDPNRNWGWNWQPEYIQSGSHQYPFSIPEDRAVADFIMAHPNIAGAQSYHNSGGMILRGPGSEEDERVYSRGDIQVYDAIGNLGEKIIPGYRYLVIYKDLYSTYGGEIEWFHGGRGIFSFTNELYTSYLMYNKTETDAQDRVDFSKRLLFEDDVIAWEPYDHPVFGPIEIGGTKKNSGRADPGFLLETDAHRNMAFTLYHAAQMPDLVIEEIEEKDLGGGYLQVTAVVGNLAIIPTHSDHDIKNKITRPDFIKLEGAPVVSGLRVLDRLMNRTEEQESNPAQISVPNISGMDAVTVRWIVKARPGADYTITVDSMKGGVVSRSKE